MLQCKIRAAAIATIFSFLAFLYSSKTLCLLLLTTDFATHTGVSLYHILCSATILSTVGKWKVQCVRTSTCKKVSPVCPPIFLHKLEEKKTFLLAICREDPPCRCTQCTQANQKCTLKLASRGGGERETEKGAGAAEGKTAHFPSLVSSSGIL